MRQDGISPGCRRQVGAAGDSRMPQLYQLRIAELGCPCTSKRAHHTTPRRHGSPGGWLQQRERRRRGRGGVSKQAALHGNGCPLGQRPGRGLREGRSGPSVRWERDGLSYLDPPPCAALPRARSSCRALHWHT